MGRAGLAFMIRSMLVALDDSPRATTVLRVADQLARTFGAKVHLFQVVDIPPEFPASAHTERDDLEEVLLRRARAALVATAVDMAGVDVDVAVCGGSSPWRLVVAKADSVGVDLIVIGSHGFGGLDHLLGTNAGRIADRAHHHVFVVHDGG